jgi:multidrug efflux pump subunit AcrA (membrane-fusion protein)
MVRKFYLVGPLTLALIPIVTAGEPRGRDNAIVLHRCILEYSKNTIIGSGMAGAIGELNVKLGDRVKAGQVLGRLRDEDLRAELEILKAEAKNTLPIQISESQYQQALAENQNNRALERRFEGLVPKLQIRQQALVTEARRQEVDQAEFARRIAQLRREQMEANILLRRFICPHDGVVAAIYKQPSEGLMVNEHVMRIVNTDEFFVTGMLDIADSWRVRQGLRVKVVPEVEGADVPIEEMEFSGQIIFVDTEIDPQSQTCKIVARVSNSQNMLRSGLAARMEILLPQAESAAKPPGSK